MPAGGHRAAPRRQEARRNPNTLNQEFYVELLLYLMRMKEDKQGGLRRTGRYPEAERHPGSRLANSLRKLRTGYGLNDSRWPSAPPTATLWRPNWCAALA